ncbi:hypothetical protein ZYGNAAKF_CDS0115 [Enterococcus phage VRE9_2]
MTNKPFYISYLYYIIIITYYVQNVKLFFPFGIRTG